MTTEASDKILQELAAIRVQLDKLTAKKRRKPGRVTRLRVPSPESMANSKLDPNDVDRYFARREKRKARR